MDFGLDLIMNRSKVKKKKYNLEKVENLNETSFLDVIRETIQQKLDIKEKIDEKLLNKIIRMSIDIYKENLKIPIDKKIEKKEIKLDFILGEPVKNINLPEVKIKEDKKITVDVKKI